jgi:hypothetical protein
VVLVKAPRDGLKRPLMYVVLYHFRQNVKARFLATSDRAGDVHSGTANRARESMPDAEEWSLDHCVYITDVDCDVFREVP